MGELIMDAAICVMWGSACLKLGRYSSEYRINTNFKVLHALPYGAPKHISNGICFIDMPMGNRYRYVWRFMILYGERAVPHQATRTALKHVSWTCAPVPILDVVHVQRLVLLSTLQGYHFHDPGILDRKCRRTKDGYHIDTLVPYIFHASTITRVSLS